MRKVSAAATAINVRDNPDSITAVSRRAARWCWGLAAGSIRAVASVIWRASGDKGRYRRTNLPFV